MGDISVDRDLQGMQFAFSDIQAKEFQCPICAKYFSRKFTLDAHMLIHKGEKPHMCQFCGKSFRQKGTLMRHKALHSSKNLFHCSLCNRGFRQKNVFIHHLRHRHNVSTETLDRRKYRTEPKDYQSIMDTLPPFVHADSTAIASSGKHFDALLSKSIHSSSVDSSELSQYSCIGENTINSTINTLNNSEQLNITICETNKFNSASPHEPNLVIDENYLGDIKPIFNNNTCEINPSAASVDDIVSNASRINNPRVLVASSFCSQLNNVTSSNDANDESIVCLPCNRSFNNEHEFKCHMKTHVQSVLLGDVNSSDLASDFKSHVSSDSAVSLNSELSSGSSVPVSSKAKSSQIQKDNPNFLHQSTFPVKTELSNSEINCASLKNASCDLTVPSSFFYKNKLPKTSKFFCPICKTFLLGEETFKKHAKVHDSYLLLKSYCDALNAKDMSNMDQIPASNVSSKSIVNHNNSSDTYSHQESQKVEHQPRRNVMPSELNKNRYSFKRFQCVQCKKIFSNKTLFVYHQQLHLNVKGFSCGFCKKSFSSKIMLLSHTRSTHFKTFSCAKCSRVFNYFKIFNQHKKKCMYNYNLKATNGGQINFPIVTIESLLNSDMDGIVGIIPVCDTASANEKSDVKVGIPVLSVAQIKALHQSSSKTFKW